MNLNRNLRITEG